MSKWSKTDLQMMQSRFNAARSSLKVEKACEMINAHVDGTKEMSDRDIKVVTLMLKVSMPMLKQVDHTHTADSDLAQFLERSRERARNHSQREH